MIGIYSQGWKTLTELFYWKPTVLFLAWSTVARGSVYHTGWFVALKWDLY